MPDDWFTANAPTTTASAPKGDWFASNAPEPERETPENGMGVVSALSAAGAAAVPALKAGAQAFVKPGLATTATRLAGRIAGPANAIKQGYDVVTGKQSKLGAAADLLAGEGARRYFRPERLIHPAVRMAQKAVAPVASALGAEGVAGMAAPLAVPLAGGLAGVAGTTGFLGALQHDANRDVPMDYTKRNLTEDIARVLGGTGATDAQMDDPTHPAFRADDSATVTAGPQPGGSSVSAAVAAFFGRRGN